MSFSNSLERIDKILFTNAVVVDPEQLTQEKSSVLVEKGKIKAIGKIKPEGFDGKVVDVHGDILCPGLIDMHVHLREPGREDEETVASGAEAAMAGGFTSICPMPNTEPTADTADVITFLKQRARDLLVDVFPIAAVSRGRAGQEVVEMGDLVAAGAVAFSDDGDAVASAEMMRRAMEYAKMFDVPIIDHCEDKSLSKDGVMNESAVSTRLGLPGIPGISEDIIVARDIQVAQFTGAKLHIAHISTANSVDLVRQAKKKGIRVTCEVMPHHFVLTDESIETYDSNFKMNPPLRTSEDVGAMLAGLKDGTIDVIATDHAPHSIEEKEVEFNQAPFGIIGLETALGLVMKTLVQPQILTLPQAIEKMTHAPAAILKLERGSLKKGALASLAILDVNRKWVVDKQRLRSRSKNTPFHGWELVGKVKGLYNQGLWWQAESK
ncbi:MAG: dihydroorotase [bacterium]